MVRSTLHKRFSSGKKRLSKKETRSVSATVLNVDPVTPDRPRSTGEILPCFEEAQDFLLPMTAKVEEINSKKGIRHSKSKQISPTNVNLKDLANRPRTKTAPAYPSQNEQSQPSIEVIEIRKRTNHNSHKRRKCIRKALSYLSEKEAYTTKGIFRECGNFGKINEVLESVDSNSNFIATEVFDSLGTFGTADLVKILLKKAKGSDGFLGEHFNLLFNVPAIIRSNKVLPISSTKCAALFINSVFCSLSQGEHRLLVQLIRFLNLVFVHKEKNFMDIQNISQTFGGILFGEPMTTDCIAYLEQTNKQKKLLEIIFSCLMRYGDTLDTKIPTPVRYFASESRTFDNQYILKGESLLQFYEREGSGYFLFHDTVLHLPLTEILSFTKDPAYELPTPPVLTRRDSRNRSVNVRKRISTQRPKHKIEKTNEDVTDFYTMLELNQLAD